eukprot:1159188-Pelagomonas_calceolata.AAC.3
MAKWCYNNAPTTTIVLFVMIHAPSRLLCYIVAKEIIGHIGQDVHDCTVFTQEVVSQSFDEGCAGGYGFRRRAWSNCSSLADLLAAVQLRWCQRQPGKRHGYKEVHSRCSTAGQPTCRPSSISACCGSICSSSNRAHKFSPVLCSLTFHHLLRAQAAVGGAQLLGINVFEHFNFSEDFYTVALTGLGLLATYDTILFGLPWWVCKHGPGFPRL